jgi:streptogramin lyase
VTVRRFAGAWVLALVACGGHGEVTTDAATVDSGRLVGVDGASGVDAAALIDSASGIDAAVDTDAASGTDAAPPDPCVVQGVPVADGVACGTDQVCRAGSCVVCVAGLRCNPGNPCHTGATVCRSGVPACVDTSSHLLDGVPCGADQVCSGGVCVACTEGVSCTFSDTFCTLTGQTSCGTGGSVCVPATTRPDGTACGDDGICLGGLCGTQLTVFPSTGPLVALVQSAFSGTLATFTDTLSTEGPGDFTVTIDWGDGTTSAGTVTAIGTETFSIAGTHAFATSGSVTVTVTVTASASGNRASTTVGVAVGVHLVPSSWNSTDVVWDPSGRAVFSSDVGVFAVYPSGVVGTLLATTDRSALSVTYDAQDNIWFGDSRGGIDMLPPAGGSPSFFGPSIVDTSRLALGPDGLAWFASTGAIGRVTTDGVVTSFPLPFIEFYPAGMTLGPDGNMWFSASTDQGYELVRVTPQGSVTTFASPGIGGLAAGPDGFLWGGAMQSLVQISLAGAVVATYPTATLQSPSALAFAADGSLWYGGGGEIDRRGPAGDVTTYPLPTLDVTALAIDPSGHVWFANAACLPDCAYGWIEP